MINKLTKPVLLSLTLFTCVLSFVFISKYENTAEVNAMPDSLADVALHNPKVVSWSNLIDHKYLPVTSDRIENHWTFVFFGYTNCPDICPATLSQLSIFNKRLKRNPELNDKVQFFFVSVDPARDKVKNLAEFISYFDSSFTAITGSESAIKLIEEQFDTYHQFEKESAPGEYAVTHSAYIYLLNPSGQLAAKFSPPINLVKVTTQLAAFVELFAKGKNLT